METGSGDGTHELDQGHMVAVENAYTFTFIQRKVTSCLLSGWADYLECPPSKLMVLKACGPRTTCSPL